MLLSAGGTKNLSPQKRTFNRFDIKIIPIIGQVKYYITKMVMPYLQISVVIKSIRLLCNIILNFITWYPWRVLASLYKLETELWNFNTKRILLDYLNIKTYSSYTWINTIFGITKFIYCFANM